jgi:hypothetical protein
VQASKLDSPKNVAYAHSVHHALDAIQRLSQSIEKDGNGLSEYGIGFAQKTVAGLKLTPIRLPSLLKVPIRYIKFAKYANPKAELANMFDLVDCRERRREHCIKD